MRRREQRTSAIVIGLAVVAVAPACRREERRFSPLAYTGTSAAGVRIDDDASVALPAPGTPNPYEGNAWAMGEGQRLFSQMNCSGCHANGGGGVAPALMDGKWRYGADDASIFTTIIGGRPNGMPSFRGRISDDQAWQLVAYVKALGGWGSWQAKSARDDHMSVRPGPLRTEPQPIVQEPLP